MTKMSSNFENANLRKVTIYNFHRIGENQFLACNERENVGFSGTNHHRVMSTDFQISRSMNNERVSCVLD